MQTISPCLWFDSQAEEAARFYASIFEDGDIRTIARYDKESSKAARMPEGTVLTVLFRIAGQECMALNGGPVFTPTPALSFMVGCESEGQLDALWQALVEGGKVRMEPGAYPFSKKYGWLDDRYGVSWQLSLTGKKQSITPSLLFVGKKYGKAEEAIRFYASVFPQSQIAFLQKREKSEGKEKAGTVQFASFQLLGQSFAAMESGLDHRFDFNPAVSLMVKCDTQEELDHAWDALTANPKAEQCGWLEDKYGISWQIVPAMMDDMLGDTDADRRERVMGVVLRSTKLEIAAIKKAYEGTMR